MYKRSLLASTVAGAAMFLAALTPASAASTGDTSADLASGPESTSIICSQFGFITIDGGRAAYRECHSGMYIRVDGHVDDTKADGRCARVRASYNRNLVVDYSARACPKGTRVTFTFPWRTSTDAYVYLFLT